MTLMVSKSHFSNNPQSHLHCLNSDMSLDLGLERTIITARILQLHCGASATLRRGVIKQTSVQFQFRPVECVLKAHSASSYTNLTLPVLQTTLFLFTNISVSATTEFLVWSKVSVLCCVHLDMPTGYCGYNSSSKVSTILNNSTPTFICQLLSYRVTRLCHVYCCN